MKAILIARVSTEEQKEAGNSLPAQEARVEKYCQSKGFEIIRRCSFDESAYTDQRYAFDAIIDFILAQRECVAVCCDKVDRLSRNIFDKRISLLYEKAVSGLIELHFVSEGQVINSRISAVEKFQFGISLGLAKYYSDAISDNVKRAQEQKLRKGEWLSKAPYGYKNVMKSDKATDIVVDEHPAYIVKQVFEWYATGAFSIELLCVKVKEEFGLCWPKGYLAKILNNPFYCGTMIVKGKSYPHRYPPIITRTLFEQVQKVKSSFLKKPCKYAGLSYLYRGMLRCGECGCSITPEKHKGHVYYHCTQYKGKHGAKWLREEEITEQLGQVFKSIQIPGEVLEKIKEGLSSLHQEKMSFHNGQVDRLTKEHQKLTTMMDNLYLDKLKGKITEAQYDKFYSSLREQLEDTTIRLAALQEAEDNYYITAKHLLELTQRAYSLFVSSEIEKKRQLLKLTLSNLRVEGQKVLYEPIKPFDAILNAADSQLWRDLWGTLRTFKWSNFKERAKVLLPKMA